MPDLRRIPGKIIVEDHRGERWIPGSDEGVRDQDRLVVLGELTKAAPLDPQEVHEPLERLLDLSINQVGRQQIELLRLYRQAATDGERRGYLVPLLLSINCIASGFGATG